MKTEINYYALCTKCQDRHYKDNLHSHIQYNGEAIHKGLDSMSLEQIIELPIGRIIEYTDILFNQYIGYIKDNSLVNGMSILSTISSLSRRERLIIARGFRHVYMEGQILLPVTSPQIYFINGVTNKLFNQFITMIENNENNITKMANLIDRLSDQDKRVVTINLDICEIRGNYR